MLVNGFDIEPRNVPLWDSTLTNISAIAAAEKIELVVVQTNIQVLADPILSWDYIHGGCLAAVGLFLRGAFRQIYIPSSFSLEEQVPWGSCLALDGHWSTENTTFVHDGIEAARLDKVIWQVAQSPLALEHLRVCYENVKGSYNCGRCDKCLRTMINLYIAGALEKSKTFPHDIDPELVSAITALPINGTFPGENQNLRGLRERNLAPDLQQAITVSINNAAAVTGKSRSADIKDRLKCLDHIYTRGYVTPPGTACSAAGSPKGPEAQGPATARSVAYPYELASVKDQGGPFAGVEAEHTADYEFMVPGVVGRLQPAFHPGQ